MKQKLTITGVEANLLLYALDEFLKTNNEGRITKSFPHYTERECQALRDRLFTGHVHPSEVYESKE